MHLKQLKISGFKSFADTYTVNFNDGLTAIVGPNGCGKSNIIDAIRWVLGEQRVKILRSEKMEDVIFSGTMKRKPLNFCEVSLSIENDDNVLPVEYKSVQITRRMFRTGESEYFLNKKIVRLKDITALFYDTGMGIGAYSLMEQKQIEKLLSDKDEERRTMFEEAAGINKYRSQRKEALKNLLKTSEDLQRLTDIVTEKDRMVKTLERHVVKAKKYREFRDELVRLDTAYCFRLFQAVSEELKTVSRSHAELRAEKERLEAEVSTFETVIQEQELLASGREEKVMETGREVETLTDEIHRLETASVALREKTEGAQLAIRQIAAYQDKLSETVTRSKEAFAALEESLIGTEARVQEAEAEVVATQREADRFDMEAAEKRLELNQAHQATIDLLEEDAALHARIEKNRSLAENLQEQRAGLERGLAEEKLRADSCSERIRQCRDLLSTVDAEHANLSASRDQLVAKIDAEESLFRRLLEQEKTLEAALISDEKKLEFFEEMNRNHEGYKDAVRSVVEKGLSGIRGIAADVLDVSPDHVAAIESALGSRVQFLLAEDEGSARSALSYLDDAKLGRASFALRSLVRGLSRPASLDGVESLEGVIGWADRFVACADEYRPLASLLLGDVLLVADLAVAERIRDRCPEFVVHCVNPRGDIATTSGIIRGGLSGAGELGLLSRSKLIDALRRNLERGRSEIAAKEQEKQSALQTLEEAKKALFQIDGKLTTGRDARQEQEGNIRHLDEEILRIRRREDETLEQVRLLERRVESHLEEERLLSRALSALEDRKTENEGRVLLLAEESKALEDRRPQLADALRAAQIKANALLHDAQSQRRERERIEGEMEEAHRTLLSNRDEVQHYQADIERFAEEIRGQEARREEILIHRKEKEQNLVRLRDHYAGLRKEIADRRASASGTQKALSEASDKVHACEMQLERLTEKRRGIQERVWQEYERDLGSLGPEAAELGMEEDAARDKIDVLRKRLKAIGPNVNLSVLEDYEQEKQGFDELSRQKADLDTAKKSLETLVRKLDKEACQKFIDNFNKVRENFRQVFITLFEGGEADLRLEDDPDPLAARIVIYARPSGKSMRPISLLSGGERALTAISLLFGLYLVKPSPYCILDEVDGPLDEANIGRFLNLIRRFSEQTQFLMVTHKKKTMAACDVLYGVTLIEPGVSQTVSVSLSNTEDEKKIDAIIGETVAG